MADNEKMFKVRFETSADDSGAKKAQKAIKDTKTETKGLAREGEGASKAFDKVGEGEFSGLFDKINKLKSSTAELREKAEDLGDEVEKTAEAEEQGLGRSTAAATRIAAYYQLIRLGREVGSEIRSLADAFAEVDEVQGKVFQEQAEFWEQLLSLDVAGMIRGTVIDPLFEPAKEAMAQAVEAKKAAEDAVAAMLDTAAGQGVANYEVWKSEIEDILMLEGRMARMTQAAMKLEQQRADNRLKELRAELELKRELIELDERTGRITPEQADSQRSALAGEEKAAVRSKAREDVARKIRASEEAYNAATSKAAALEDELNQLRANRVRLESRLDKARAEAFADSAAGRTDMKAMADRERLAKEVEAITADEDRLQDQVGALQTQSEESFIRLNALKSSMDDTLQSMEALEGTADKMEAVKDTAAKSEEEMKAAAGVLEDHLTGIEEGGVRLNETGQAARAELQKVVEDGMVTLAEMSTARQALNDLLRGVADDQGRLMGVTQAVSAEVQAHRKRLADLEQQTRTLRNGP